jgi:hypothetical protein
VGNQKLATGKSPFATAESGQSLALYQLLAIGLGGCILVIGGTVMVICCCRKKNRAEDEEHDSIIYDKSLRDDDDHHTSRGLINTANWYSED